MAMTVKEHDEFWMAAARSIQSIPGVADSLRRANAIEILKELYNCGAMSTADYTKALMYIAELERFDFKDMVDNKKIGL